MEDDPSIRTLSSSTGGAAFRGRERVLPEGRHLGAVLAQSIFLLYVVASVALYFGGRRAQMRALYSMLVSHPRSKLCHIICLVLIGVIHDMSNT